ncbi:MAG: sugar kinase [Bacteroidetes bacterium]|nr:sugar kinase [Bacteroidota bacterium]
MNKKLITFGEVLMRLSPPGFLRIQQADQFKVIYAGSEANVAVSCAHFGLTTKHVTVLPDDDLGTAAVQQLKLHGVGTDHIQRHEGRIGIYFYENASAVRSPKIIYDRYHSAFANIQSGSVNWDMIMNGADWFHWTGITPAVSEGAAAVCLQALQSAKRNGVKVSGDINYRRVLWQYGKLANEVMPELISYCNVIVGGIEDFKNCLNIDDDQFHSACSKVIAKFPSIKKIASIQRETISSSHQHIQGIMSTGDRQIQTKKYELFPIVDRIGAGDAFMAGLIYGELSGKEDQSILDFATAACALKHTVEGDVNSVSINEVEEVLSGKTTGKLLR